MKCKCLLFLLLFCSTTFAQIIKSDTLPIEFPYKNYTILDGLASNETYYSLIDSRGFIWISSDKGVSKFDGYEFVNYTTNDGLIDNTIFNIFEDNRGRIWFLGMNKKLCYYDWYQDKIISFKFNNVIDSLSLNLKIINPNFEILHKQLNGELIVNKQIIEEKFQEEYSKQQNIRKFNTLVFSVEINGSVKLYLQDKIFIINKFGVLKEELFCNNKIIENKENDIVDKSNIKNLETKEINHLFKNQKYTIVTTKSNGFYIINNNQTIKNISLENFKNAGIYEDESTIHFDSQNKYIHVARNANGIYNFYTIDKNGTNFYYPHLKNINSQKFYSGVQFTSEHLENYGLTLSSITVTENEIYSTHENTLDIHFQDYIKPVRHESRIFSSCWFKDTLILGTENGLAFLDKDTLIKSYPIKNLDLGNERIQCLATFNKALIIATRVNGFYVINLGEIQHVTKINGLTGTFINHLFIRDDVIWIGTNKGVCAFSLQDNNIKFLNAIDISQGILSNDVRQVFVKDNTVYLGLANGISTISLDKLNKENSYIELYLKSVNINDSIPLNKFKKNYTLAYFQNNISISFMGISPTYSKNVLYRFKLNGTDNNTWQETYDRSILFNFLPPGNYEFEVQVQNEKGEWQENGIKILFNIKSPFWKTFWFKFLVLSCIFSIIFSFFLFLIKKKAKEDNLKLSLSITEHKALLNQMNPHFIFNSLNSTQNFLLKNDVLSANKYLVKLARLIRDSFENSKKTFIPLHDELNSIGLYVDLENMRFKNQITLQINIKDEIDTKKVLIPTLLIQPFVENAIHHGILMKQDSLHGVIEISIFKSGNSIKITIEDNGIGRVAAKLLKKNETFENKKSNGVEITKNRIEIINQIEKVAFEFNIIDLYDDKNQAQGTKVVFSIPLKNEL